jgi:hypothetical protein
MAEKVLELMRVDLVARAVAAQQIQQALEDLLHLVKDLMAALVVAVIKVAVVAEVQAA